jgi:hypothetical protein
MTESLCEVIEQQIQEVLLSGELDRCPELVRVMEELEEAQNPKIEPDTSEQDAKAEALRQKSLLAQQQTAKLNLSLKIIVEQCHSMHDWIQQSAEKVLEFGGLGLCSEAFKSYSHITQNLDLSIFYLLNLASQLETELQAQDRECELTSFYLRQGICYCQRYLNQQLRPDAITFTLTRSPVPQQQIQRFQRYISLLSSHSLELSLRLKIELSKSIQTPTDTTDTPSNS